MDRQIKWAVGIIFTAGFVVGGCTCVGIFAIVQRLIK